MPTEMRLSHICAKAMSLLVILMANRLSMIRPIYFVMSLSYFLFVHFKSKDVLICPNMKIKYYVNLYKVCRAYFRKGKQVISDLG